MNRNVASRLRGVAGASGAASGHADSSRPRAPASPTSAGHACWQSPAATLPKVGRRDGFSVLEPRCEPSEVYLVVDQVTQRVLEASRQQLPSIGNRNHLGLLRVVVPVSRHRRYASFAALLRVPGMIGCGLVFLQLR